MQFQEILIWRKVALRHYAILYSSEVLPQLKQSHSEKKLRQNPMEHI